MNFVGKLASNHLHDGLHTGSFAGDRPEALLEKAFYSSREARGDDWDTALLPNCKCELGSAESLKGHDACQNLREYIKKVRRLLHMVGVWCGLFYTLQSQSPHNTDLRVGHPSSYRKVLNFACLHANRDPLGSGLVSILPDSINYKKY